MRPLTPQQIADAAAKRAASIAQRKASGGMTVRQQRAAAKAAKAGQPAPPPPAPKPPKPPRAPRPQRFGRRRGRFNNFSGPRPGTVQQPTTPIFTTPKPDARALKLSALVAIEVAFQQTPRAAVTDEMRTTWERYQKVKAMFLATPTNARQDVINEANVALRQAVLMLVKLAF